MHVSCPGWRKGRRLTVVPAIQWQTVGTSSKKPPMTRVKKRPELRDDVQEDAGDVAWKVYGGEGRG